MKLQCQSAALDELFGKPGVCFPRYQTAQILFHSLAQQTDHPQDKNILGKCMFIVHLNTLVSAKKSTFIHFHKSLLLHFR